MKVEEKERHHVFIIPANYTDSGRLFGGLVAPRNAIEALVLALLIGIPLGFLLPAGGIRVVTLVLTVLPAALAALVGIDSDSLFRYLYRIFRFLHRRRKLHFRRVGKKDVSEKRT